jgi:4-hydroxy-tetrahydrodipicolinate synthase
MVTLKGVLPPMVTPFKKNSDQDVDELALRNLTNFLIEKGVHGLVPTGGAGEYVYLSHDEWKKVNETVVDETNGRVPVAAGILDPGTKNVIEKAKIANDLGADAIMVLIHQYYFPSDEEMYKHFESISVKSDMPIMLYNSTRFSGKDISVNVIKKLVNGNHINSIKDSTRDFLHIARLIDLCGDKVTMLKGMAEDFLPALIICAEGTVTTGSNCFPEKLVSIWDNFHKKNYEKCQELHKDLISISELMRKRMDVRITKEALDLLGILTSILFLISSDIEIRSLCNS